jgi:hypothetical protein
MRLCRILSTSHDGTFGVGRFYFFFFRRRSLLPRSCTLRPLAAPGKGLVEIETDDEEPQASRRVLGAASESAASRILLGALGCRWAPLDSTGLFGTSLLGADR